MVMELADVPVYAEKLDVSDKAGVYAFAQAVKAELGNAHVIINNAARVWLGSRLVPFKRMRHILWQQMGRTLNAGDYKGIQIK